eukprot:403372336
MRNLTDPTFATLNACLLVVYFAPQQITLSVIVAANLKSVAKNVQQVPINGTSFQNITSSKQLQANEQIVVKHPNRIYLYFVSNSIINGNFTFEAQYLPVINNTQAAQNSWLNYNSSNQSVLTAYSNQYKLIKSQVHGEKKFIDSIDHSKLVIAVVVILLALIMISLSIAFLIAVKRSPKQQLSQQIVRSVQNLEEAQQLNNMDQSSQFLNVGNSSVSKIFKNQYDQEEFKEDSRKYNFDGSGSDRAPQKGQFLPDINQSALNQQQLNDFLAEFNRLHELLNDDQKRELAQRFGKQNKFGPQQQTILEDANEDYEYDTESDSGENQEDKKSRLYRQLEAIRKILRDDDDMLRHQYTDKDDIDEIKRSEGDYNSIRSSQIAEEDEDNKMDMRMTRAKFFTFSDNKNASASKDDSAVVQQNTDQKNMFHNTKPKDHNFGMSKTDANFFKPQEQLWVE